MDDVEHALRTALRESAALVTADALIHRQRRRLVADDVYAGRRRLLVPAFAGAMVVAVVAIAASLLRSPASTLPSSARPSPRPSSISGRTPNLVWGGPLPTTPHAGSGHLFVSSWTSDPTTDPGSRRIELTVQVGGSCDTFDYVDVRQSATAVTIAPIIRHDQPAGTWCGLSLTGVHGYVDLTEPLRSRTLRHAKTTQP